MSSLSGTMAAGAGLMGQAALGLAFFAGTLVPCFLVSRLFLWLTRKSTSGGNWRVLACHAGSLALATVLGGLGMADGGPFAGAQAFQTYALPQLVLFIVDLWRRRESSQG